MTSQTRQIAVIGSSGSIGQNALDVIINSHGTLNAILLSVHKSTDILAQQILQIAHTINQPKNKQNNTITTTITTTKTDTHHLTLPRWVVVTDLLADRSPLERLPFEIISAVKIVYGYEALCELVREPEIDIVLSAVSGCVGLNITWSALDAGKCVALANKESLVSGGSLITELALKKGGKLIPVDSEHSAILQALQTWRMNHYPTQLINHTDNLTHHKEPPITTSSAICPDTNCIDQKKDRGNYCNENNYGLSARGAVNKIILTASGGPFRQLSQEELNNVTVADALRHPTWRMGSKITIDSATLMNKAFEIIEARWFFDLCSDEIGVLIHPQSIIHSMVEFIDGSTIAQLSQPDMRIPISLALHYPDRFELRTVSVNWQEKVLLEFYPPDLERFPAIKLGFKIADTAGTTGVVVNASNETAVAAFLNGKLPFHDIVTVCNAVLENHNFEQSPTLSRLFELDNWARKETEKWISH
ncbi:MAG: 1-deoxy-D-xylulose-5-phosphate reductoisomerase [Planctomycetaceae bacterium]|nr:1-deoxy-D-xylulose-5-phosphate reductoisomerase [Planctomycetaceae bacterium]